MFLHRWGVQETGPLFPSRRRTSDHLATWGHAKIWAPWKKDTKPQLCGTLCVSSRRPLEIFCHLSDMECGLIQPCGDTSGSLPPGFKGVLRNFIFFFSDDLCAAHIWIWDILMGLKLKSLSSYYVKKTIYFLLKKVNPFIERVRQIKEVNE